MQPYILFKLDIPDMDHYYYYLCVCVSVPCRELCEVHAVLWMFVDLVTDRVHRRQSRQAKTQAAIPSWCWHLWLSDNCQQCWNYCRFTCKLSSSFPECRPCLVCIINMAIPLLLFTYSPRGIGHEYIRSTVWLSISRLSPQYEGHS